MTWWEEVNGIRTYYLMFFDKFASQSPRKGIRAVVENIKCINVRYIQYHSTLFWR